MSAKNEKAKSASVDYRIKDGGPLSGAWKIWAGIGALGLAGAGAGYASDAKRFAFSYLFAFFCFLTIALGSLFFVLVQHLTKAGWSVTVRRPAEFMMSGLPVFAVLALPILLMASTLYPWINVAKNHAAGGSHAAGGAHGALESLSVESTAHAAQAHEAEHVPESAPKAGEAHDSHAAPAKAAAHGSPAAGSSRDAELEHAEHEMHEKILLGKDWYLNTTFFYLRALLYMAAWILLPLAFFKLSTEQDKTKSLQNTNKAQALAPIAALLFGISITFAGIDWVMALDPMWYSTMWGVQLFAGAVVSMFAVLLLTTISLRKNKLTGDAITIEHFHDLGKLQFGFLVFWAYISFSQFFLIWYSNIPEETTFYSRRWHDMDGSWRGVSWALFACHFVLPFALLLSRNVKRRLDLLQIGAGIILVMHFVEIYWIVMPTIGALSIHWMDIACFLGVGGVYFALVFRNMLAHSLIPVGDPRLPRALHFEQA